MPGIVLIEDDAPMRELLLEWLGAEGYRSRAVATGDLRTGETADLVIVDLHMPRHRAAETVRLARDANPGTPIIAISGQFCQGVAATGTAACALGVQRRLAKPFSRRAILEAVRSVIGAAR